MRSFRPYLFVFLLGGFVAIQFAPVERSNPRVSREVRWDSPETRALAKRACFDCHSNETVWPWYSRVAPVSWLVAGDVNEARGKLNFSVWHYPNEDFDEIEEQLEKGEMPLWEYLLLHGNAKLSPAETARLIEGLKATFAADPPISRSPPESEGDSTAVPAPAPTDSVGAAVPDSVLPAVTVPAADSTANPTL